MPQVWLSCPQCRVLFPSDTDAGTPVLCSACGASLTIPATVQPEGQWYYARGRQKVGPVPWSELERLIASGQLTPQDMVLRQGEPKWVPVSSLAAAETFRSGDLRLLREGLPPSGPPPPSPTLVRPAAVPPADGVPSVAGYEILRELGRGGMGVVYLARQTRLKRPVALKMVLAGDHAAPEELARFKAEAEAVARLQHPNIVQIFEVGEWRPGGAGPALPFFSLEFCEGGSLANRTRGQPQPARDAAALVEVLARAMHFAHERGIVHRDLKPANVLLASGGSKPPDPSPASGGLLPPLADCVPKVADFGLAKQLDADSGQTRSGAIMGTPAYMAPEQASGRTKEIGPACDIWALGAILYDLLTGRPPFKADTPVETLDQVRTLDPKPPRRLNARVPRDLETICLKCLHKEPARRYATALELADDLKRFLNFEPIQARRVGVWERGAKWARRRPAAVLAALVAVLLLAGAPAGWWLWHEREQSRLAAEQARQEKEERERREAEATELRVEYRPNLVLRWNVPEGDGPVLTAGQAARRRTTYKVYRRGGRTERVEVVNGHGAPTHDHPLGAILQPGGGASGGRHTECSFAFHYDTQGRLIREEAHDAHGRPVWSFRFLPGTDARGWYADRNGLPLARAASGASQVRFVWSKDGLADEMRFLDAKAQPQPDDNGAWGLRFRYDARGRVTRATCLGADGRPAVNLYGYVTVARAYDDDGNLVEESYLDAADKPTKDQNGVHKVKTRFDAAGNLVEVSYYVKDGERDQPACNADGVHRFQARFNEHGDLVEVAHFGTKGEPVTDRTGTHRWTAAYDSRGNRTEEATFGLKGERVAARQGIALQTTRYNEQGDIVEQAYFGADGKPLTLPEGYHRFRARYDGRGYQTEVAYFDAHDQPVRLSRRPRGPRRPDAGDDEELPTPEGGGYHKLVRRHDDQGQVVQITFYDTDGKPLALLGRAASWKMKYDAQGRLTERACFDAEGRPVALPQGYHREVRTHDGAGGGDISFFGTDGRRALHRDGYHRWELKVQRQGDGSAVETRTCYGLDGLTTVNRYGITSVGRMYFSATRETLVLYFGKGGMSFDEQGQVKMDLALHRDGYACVLSRSDERGRVVEEKYLGLRREPVITRKGYSRITRTFDDKGGPPKETYWALDAAGRYVFSRPVTGPGGRVESLTWHAEDATPAAHRDGYHKLVNRYDSAGRLTELAYFGLDGKPVVPAAGFARLTISRNARGQETERVFFDAKGRKVIGPEGFARGTIAYDNAGNETERAFYDPDGRLLTSKQGFARGTIRYDPRGREIERAYYGPDGQRMIGPQGFARRTRLPDDKDRPLEEAYFGADDKPMLTKEGYHKGVARYDAEGHIIDQRWFGTDGQPVAVRGGWHRMTLRYHPGGQVEETAYFGTDGRPTTCRDGYHRVTFRCNDRRQIRETAYFGPDGKPTALPVNGYARMVSTYDAEGNVTAVDFWGLDAGGRFLRGRRQWGPNATTAVDAFFTEDDRPARHRDGYHQIAIRFDGAGREIERAYLGLDGKPAAHREGHAKIVFGRLFQPNGDPQLDPNGYHAWADRFDLLGRRIEQAFFDAQEQPTACRQGYHKVRMRYDAKGRLVEQAYFAVDGRPARHSDGDHRFRLRYDDAGREVERAYFDENDRPVVGVQGYARVRHAFDRSGRWLDLTLFDAKDNPLPVETSVAAVTPGGKADRAGLKPGDLLLSYDGKEVVNPPRFLLQHDGERVGPPRELRVRRGNQEMTLALPRGDLGLSLSYVARRPGPPR